MTAVIPVILCGGSGTRLWPLSRSGFPKQFLAISGGDAGHSLFQEAITRINAFANPGFDLQKILVVANEDHRFLALDQLDELVDTRVTLVLEPVGRNTAPALTLAALLATESLDQKTQDPILIVLPADQAIKIALHLLMRYRIVSPL